MRRYLSFSLWSVYAVGMMSAYVCVRMCTSERLSTFFVNDFTQRLNPKREQTRHTRTHRPKHKHKYKYKHIRTHSMQRGRESERDKCSTMRWNAACACVCVLHWKIDKEMKIRITKLRCGHAVLATAQTWRQIRNDWRNWPNHTN